ncbi:MAG: TetR/AcrR family transcriptional regulator [Marinilabiliales bacterium]
MHKTKLLLIKKGYELMSDKGFYATSIRDVILAAGIPKGSFYYYFESKEMYCLEIINYLSDIIDNISLKHINKNNDFDTKDIMNFIEEIFNNNTKTGLLILKLSSELSARTDFLGEAIKHLIDTIINYVSILLAKKHEAYKAQELADMLIFSRIGLVCKELQNVNSPRFNQQIIEDLYKVFLDD